MTGLTEPSPALAVKILGDVSFEDRFIGFVLRRNTGPRRIFLYGFQEVLGLLDDEHPRIDYGRLAIWIKEIIGDEELAGLIATVDSEAASNYEKNILVRNLMAERLGQCQGDKKGNK